MAKDIKQDEIRNEKEACEIIELALDDLDVLTRVFGLISEICSETESGKKDDFLLQGAWQEELLN